MVNKSLLGAITLCILIICLSVFSYGPSSFFAPSQLTRLLPIAGEHSSDVAVEADGIAVSTESDVNETLNTKSLSVERLANKATAVKLSETSSIHRTGGISDRSGRSAQIYSKH